MIFSYKLASDIRNEFHSVVAERCCAAVLCCAKIPKNQKIFWVCSADKKLCILPISLYFGMQSIFRFILNVRTRTPHPTSIHAENDRKRSIVVLTKIVILTANRLKVVSNNVPVPSSVPAV